MKIFSNILILLLAAISTLSAQTKDIPDSPPMSEFPIADNPPNSTPPASDNPAVLTPPASNNPPTSISLPPSSNIPPSTPSPIGTISQPVTVGEYCTFLTDTLAPQSEPSLEAVKKDFGITDETLLACDGFFDSKSSFNNYNFYWDLNRSNELITTVPSPEVQQLFNKWRSNPYSQELLDYMIDTYHTDPASVGSKIGKSHITYAPSNILQLYPHSSTLAKAKNLAIYPTTASYLLYNERGVSVIDPRTPINPRNFISTPRYQLPQPDYHRPLLIGPKN